MRIGIDCRLWNESGVGRYTRNLVHYLQELDKENEYILFGLTKDAENIKSQISNIKFQIKTADIRWHTIAEQLQFPKLLNKEKLDLVHFPYFSIPVFYRGKFVITIHDLILHHFPTGKASTLSPFLFKLKLFGYKYVIQKATEEAEKIIAVSKTTKDDIVKTLHIPKDKIIVIYEGIDETIKSKSKTRPIENPYFLYVGNAYPHKNLEKLIEAFRKIELHYPQMVLILVGKEDYFYKKIKEKVKKINMGKSIIFYGQADDSQLSSLYSHAKALVAPSLMEGFGLPLLEAMSKSCLVAASDIPSTREICSDAAVYFDPHSVSSIESSLERVLKEKFEENITFGLKWAEKFSFEKMAKETLAIYTASIA